MQEIFRNPEIDGIRTRKAELKGAPENGNGVHMREDSRFRTEKNEDILLI